MLPASAEPSGETDLAAPVIRTITIEVNEIFDEPDIGVLYRAVNAVKFSTREEVVRRELLVQEGDRFDEFLLQESERNLRSLPFIRQVSITPIQKDGIVDLLVSVQDTWTLFPFFTLSSGGGTSKQAIGLTEGNVLGYGKRLELLSADDEGRSKVEGVWDDRRLFGTYQRLTLGHFQRSDGNRSIVSLGRPFRSLVEPYAWSLDADVFDLVGRLFAAGEERFIFRQKRSAFAGTFTIPRGDPEVLIRRYTLGYNYTDDEFDPADAEDFEDVDVDPDSVSQDPNQLAENRRFSGPLFSFSQIEPDFISINFVDRFERVEDFNLGNQFRVQMHFALDALSSARDTLLFSASDSDGIRLTPTSFVRGEIGTSLRLDEEGLNNLVLSGQAKYYNILGAKYVGGVYIGKHTLASSLSITIGEELDKDIEYLLGARNGLRGYKDRTFTGDHLIVANLEDRFYLIEDVFRLVSVGGAVFIDAGGTSSNGIGDIITDELYADVGFGLRFGISRSSGGSVVRLDVAFPLREGPDGSDRFEPRILLTTGQLFSARLRSDDSSRSTAAVSAGFLR